MDSSRQFEFDRRRHHDSGSGPVEAAKHDDDDDVDGNVNVNDNPPPGHQIRCWGRSFTWTVHHFTPTHLHPLKYTYDKLADDCLAQLHPLQSSTTDKQHPTDLYALLKSTHHTHPHLSQFWHQTHTTPSWVSWDQIQRAQDVFHRYSLPIARALKSLSLTGGMSASRIVETLYRTGGFSPSSARRRVLETTHFIISIMSSLRDIQPGGKGHQDAIRVRLLHASVRRRILALEEKRKGYYSVAKYGVPGNTLDSIATICSFSSAVVYYGLPPQGVYMRQHEIVDFIALWRLVAWYLGTPDTYFSTPDRARAVLESIVVAEIKPSERGGLMARSIIASMADTPPMYVSRELSNATVRWLVGKEIADGLGVDDVGVWCWMVLFGNNCVVAMWCYIMRSVGWLDRWQVAKSRKQWKENLMSPTDGLGKDADFQFEHVPDYHKKTSFKQRVPPMDMVVVPWRLRHRTEIVGVFGLGIIASAISICLLLIYWLVSLAMIRS